MKFECTDLPKIYLDDEGQLKIEGGTFLGREGGGADTNIVVLSGFLLKRINALLEEKTKELCTDIESDL